MSAFEYIEKILFILSAFTICYHLFYALIGGMMKRGERYKDSRKKHRFAILIPTFKDDEYIISSVESILSQDYPIDCYDIFVIAEQLEESTIATLSQHSITIIPIDLEGKSSKMKAVKAGIHTLPEGMYDLIMVMNADNTIEPNFLNQINNAYASGSNAIQGHRIRLERNNNSSMLNAITDEINNCIYRNGHVNIGLSSSLNGSGMAFDFQWMKEAIDQLGDYEDEKAIEALLLQDRMYIDYIDKAHVYANRKEGRKKFYTQRQNWIKAHYSSLFSNIFKLPKALFSGNFDYADRIINWITFPRTILIPIIITMGTCVSFYDWMSGLKWWSLILLLMLAMAFAIPDYLVDAKFNKAMKALPAMGIGMILNALGFFRNK